MRAAGDRYLSARGWEPAAWWEVVGWAIQDPEGLYLTSLRRMMDRSIG